MSSTFLGIETAKRGLNASQVALNIAGNNIANADTEGYTRQRVDIVSMAVHGQSARYAMSQQSLAGQGVSVSGIGQIRDSFLDKRYRDEVGDVGYYSKALEVLTDVEAALDEYSSSALKDAMAGLFKAFNDLSINSDQAVNANIVLTAAKRVVQVLNSFDSKLNDITEQQTFALEVDVATVNSTLERIAALNKSINQEIFSSSLGSGLDNYGPNELYDERNLLVDKLAKFGNISVDQNEDGSLKIKMNGHVVVDGTSYETMNLMRNADSTVTLNWIYTGDKISLNSGSLKASVDMINGRGSEATGDENFEQGIRYYKDMINDFASNLMTEFNRIFPVSGGNGYKEMFSSGGNNIVTAGNIQISADWQKDPAYIIDGAVDKDGEYDNTFILKGVELFSKKINFRSMTGSFEEYINDYNTSKIGQQVVFYQSRLDTANTITNTMMDRRDSVSAVQMDEEGANIMRFQKAYNAMARVMTALDEALEMLINKTGLVGR